MFICVPHVTCRHAQKESPSASQNRGFGRDLGGAGGFGPVPTKNSLSIDVLHIRNKTRMMNKSGPKPKTGLSMDDVQNMIRLKSAQPSYRPLALPHSPLTVLPSVLPPSLRSFPHVHSCSPSCQFHQSRDLTSSDPCLPACLLLPTCAQFWSELGRGGMKSVRPSSSLEG